MSIFCRRVLSGIVITFFALASHANAQNSSAKGTPAESKTGQSTVSTYARDKIETVNLANGNFSLSIPLATVGGRGSASYTIALSYNSKVWSTQLDREMVATEGPPGVPPPGGTPVNHYSAMYDDASRLNPYEPGLSYLGGGWTIRTAPGVKALTVGIDYVPTTQCNVRTENIPDCGFAYALTKMWLTLPDGSQVELRDSATEGAPAPTTHITNGYHQLIDRDRGRIWHSADGSNVIFVRDANDTAVGGSEPFYPTGWVFLPDGTRVRMDAGAGSKIIDRNGNFISINGAGYTDELGRQTLFQIVNGVLTLTARGYGGVLDRSISINTGVIGDLTNLRADFRSLPRPFTTGDALHEQTNYYEHTIATPHTDLFNESEGVIAYGLTAGADVGERTAVTQLTLMDGRSLRFRYNQYGEVAEIVYPGGGVSQIDYHGGPSGLCHGSAPIHMTLNRTVSERRALTDGTNVDATWDYALNGGELMDGVMQPTATVAVHQGGATGTLLASEKHFFRMLNAEYRSCGGSYTGTGNEKWENAKEFRTETQTGTGTTVIVREWQQRAPVVWGSDPGSGSNSYVQQHGQEQTANDPRVAWEETTLEDGKVKRVEYGYDQFNNVTSIKEYDFGTAGNPGTLLRQTLRTYGANLGGNYGISINGYCYSNLNPADSSCGGGLASDVTSIIYQPHLLLNETIKDGQGNQKSYSQFEYDNYTTSANHAAIWPNNGMIQSDGSQFSLFATSLQPRGNVTKVTRWLSGGTDVVAYSQYDNAGQVIWSKDPKGNVSTISYTDNFGTGSTPDSGAAGPNGATFAFPTLATNALGQQSRMQYNYSLGAVSGVKDLNGIITQTEFDNLGRPSQVTAALGLSEQTVAQTTYPTSTLNESTASRQLDAARWLVSKTEFDGFDRPFKSWQSESSQQSATGNFTIRADTVYDAIGRVKQVSNPYRPATESPVYTTTGYDLAGRVVSVTTPDSAVVSTSYYANTVIVTDQAGKQRKSVTDALGRLKEVYEAPNDSNYNYLTSYSYDTLDNLTSVSQGTQPPRGFGYDSLKRLTSATNPESGTITYQYDANGNLMQKTDARGVVSAYVYDVLNRNTSVTYTNDPASTPTVHRYYDGLRDGVNNNIPYSKGRLWQTETSGATASRTTINSFDAMGRPLSESQQFYSGSVWSQAYTVQRAPYNLAGGVTSQTYPSGHTVSYNYDAAGRLGDKDAQNLAFTGSLGDGATRTYSRAISYSPLGSMVQEQFGTDAAIYNKLAYNSRGQLAEIKESTTPNDASWNRGKFVNWYSLQCGTVGSPDCNATDNNGNLKKQATFVPNNDQNTSPTSWYQQYEYDNLNRLTQVHEHASNNSQLWQQSYVYDRYGNRTINTATNQTWGSGINNREFAVETATNRLYAPGDLSLAEASRQMQYDEAGNLKKDVYSGAAVSRAYDAENRMTSETQANNSVAGAYTYNADGQRVRRKVNSVETWQIYGMDGELLAEYAASAATTIPQKEYGYRNGQLLITAEPSVRTNVALAANGATATAQNYTQDGVYTGLHFQPSFAIDGLRHTTSAGGNLWRDEHGLTSWLEVDFSGAKSIDEIDVVTEQIPDYQNATDPTATQTFTSQGASAYDVQYWTGSAWATVSGGAISGNNLVWKKLNFTAVTTAKIRVVVNASSDNVARIVEVEAWGTAAARTNVALVSSGATASAQNYTQDGVYPGMYFQPAKAIDGLRHTSADGAGYWRDEHGLSSWLEIDFAGSQSIDEIDVYTMGDYPFYTTGTDPSATQTFSQVQGATAFTVQYWNGSAWATVPGGTITGNNLVWKKLSFTAVATRKSREPTWAYQTYNGDGHFDE